MTKDSPSIVIFLGPPGSGKGTQAVRVSQSLAVPHISTGDLFRDHLKNETALGKRVKGYMDQGQLVPDEIVLDMLFERVAKGDCTAGYLLDGFPRTLPQAEALALRLPKGTRIMVVDFQVPDESIVKRMSGRLTCAGCGRVYNRYFSPPAQEGVCDVCGSALYQRSDDGAAIVQDRLRIYHTQTKPLIAYYEAQGLLHAVDGDRPPDAVFADIMALLRS